MQCDGCISGNISFDSVCCVNEVHMNKMRGQE